MINDDYRLVMDDSVNGFSDLPKITRFQLMTVMSYVWSAIFSAGIGSYFLFGTLVVLHTLVIAGIFFTAYMFKKSRKQYLDHRDAFRSDKDGCARYDDIWGGA